MANPLPAFAYPAHDLAWQASAGMTNEDPTYPATNAINPDPADVAKSTTTTTTITIGTVAAHTPVAVALINTNAETATVAGLPVTIPPVDHDGQRVHGWRRLEGLAPSSAWTVTLTRASGVVWIGRIVLVTELYPLNLRYGLQWGRRRPGDVIITTRLGSVMKYGSQIRTRWVEGETDLYEDEDLRRVLEANARGPILPFLFIPDENVNDAWFGSFRTDDFSITIPDLDVRTCPFRFEELSSGPPQG